jgi:uroporphyrinogen decarboxylase
MPDIAKFPQDVQSKARWLVDRARANGGLAPADLERFWADQEVARKDPFGRDIPQVPLGIMMSGECVFDELGVKEDYWRYDHDDAWQLELNTAYNDKAQKIVGRRLLSEKVGDPNLRYPPLKGLHDVFEARNEWHDRSWWLRQSAHNEDELTALLDRVEQRLEDIRGFILPENWEQEKHRLTALGVKPPLYRGQRGPVTFAASVYGVENLLFLILDKPDLAVRLRDAILKAMLEIARVLDEEAGYTPQNAPHGFSFCDDNCCLLNPGMYELFGYPVLKAIFERYSPDPTDNRYQHSDSAMGHLLPILGRLNFTGVNFGPKLTVSEIRRHCPTAVIHGQLAPFTFSRNQEENIVCEFLRDFEVARQERGLLFSTAGSINNGSRLSGMRLIMSAIQHFGRF